MIDTIVSSKTANKLLAIFVTHPQKEFYLRQLSRMSASSLRPTQLALAKLTKACILTSRRQANFKYYKINRKSPIYDEVRNIILKTEGVGKLLEQELKGLRDITCAFIYGSLARDKMKASSDIDICLIGNIRMDDLAHVVRRLEDKLSREVSMVTFTPSEWRKKLKSRNAFIKDILKSKKIKLIGDIDEV